MSAAQKCMRCGRARSDQHTDATRCEWCSSVFVPATPLDPFAATSAIAATTALLAIVVGLLLRSGSPMIVFAVFLVSAPIAVLAGAIGVLRSRDEAAVRSHGFALVGLLLGVAEFALLAFALRVFSEF